MTRAVVVFLIILAVATVMTMTGRGGGNFYVPLLVAVGEPIHAAATTGQFVLLVAAGTAMLLFHTQKLVDWKLALIIDPATDIMAFVGGLLSGRVNGMTLKLVLAGLLAVAGVLMLIKTPHRPIRGSRRWGFWCRQFGDYEYVVNLWLAIPLTAAVGLIAGAVGISGGSFKIPLMVLLCGVPMHIAVGTSSAMVAATALMGLLGHACAGHFDLRWALPAAGAAVIGSLVGGKLALRSRPKALKAVFAATAAMAAVFMVVHACVHH